MKMAKVGKTFNCLEYKDRVQAKIYEEIKDLSIEQQVAYFRKRAESGSFGKWWKTPDSNK